MSGETITAPACRFGFYLPGDMTLPDGERVTLSSTGGADFEAFSLEVTIPAVFEFSAPTLVLGEPMTVSWPSNDD